jgi:hypothetical protein
MRYYRRPPLLSPLELVHFDLISVGPIANEVPSFHYEMAKSGSQILETGTPSHQLDLCLNRTASNCNCRENKVVPYHSTNKLWSHNTALNLPNFSTASIHKFKMFTENVQVGVHELCIETRAFTLTYLSLLKVNSISGGLSFPGQVAR